MLYTAVLGRKSANKKARPYRRVEWQRLIFPCGCPHSIIRAGRLNCRVRDGNGCFPSAIVTTPPACTNGTNSGIFPDGDEGIRTPDLRRAKAALFQLSYVPAFRVGLPGLEPGTSVLSGLPLSRCSIAALSTPLQGKTEQILVSCLNFARKGNVWQRMFEGSNGVMSMRLLARLSL
jgi:hypothetical protein